jgi:hypothetical protein
VLFHSENKPTLRIEIDEQWFFMTLLFHGLIKTHETERMLKRDHNIRGTTKAFDLKETRYARNR